MTFWSALKRCYTASWTFMAALPLITVAIVGVEGLQHVVEFHSGMYDSLAAAKAHANDCGRLIAGSCKVAWLLIVGYWTARYFVSGSARETLALQPVAVRKYAVVSVLYAAMAALVLFGPEILPNGHGRVVQISMLLVQVVTMPIGVMLTPWIIGSALGDLDATIAASFREARGSIFWGLALTIFAPLPLLAAHYVFEYWAMGQDRTAAIAILCLDAVMVGYLGVVITMSSAVLADRMAARAGRRLRLGRP